MYLNPYLFLLLKKLIKLEVELQTGNPPTIENIKAFIADKEGATDNPKDAVSVAAWAIAEYIRKMWSKTEFAFPEFYLDRMVKLLSSIVSYQSWKDFSKVERANQLTYFNFGNKFIGDNYKTLNHKIKQVLDMMSDERATVIFFKFGSQLDDEYRKKMVDNIKEGREHHGHDSIVGLSTYIDPSTLRPLDKQAIDYLLRKMSPNG